MGVESCGVLHTRCLRALQGVDKNEIFCISAVTGEGVLDLVRGVRKRLDQMPQHVPVLETDAANVREAPSKKPSDARISEFTIESDLAGPRLWFVKVSTRSYKQCRRQTFTEDLFTQQLLPSQQEVSA